MKLGVSYKAFTTEAGQDKCDLITDHQVPGRFIISGLRSHLVS